MRNLSPSEVAALLLAVDGADGGAAPLLLDVREPWEFGICQIPGSRSLPMHQVPGNLSQLDRSRPLIIICHHGIRSLQVARFLEQQGFDQVINLQGGVAAWARELDPAMPTY